MTPPQGFPSCPLRMSERRDIIGRTKPRMFLWQTRNHRRDAVIAQTSEDCFLRTEPSERVVTPCHFGLGVMACHARAIEYRDIKAPARERTREARRKIRIVSDDCSPMKVRAF